jgi:hypothetical protein
MDGAVVNPDQQPTRPWRVVAEELSREADAVKVVALAEELNDLLARKDKRLTDAEERHPQRPRRVLSRSLSESGRVRGPAGILAANNETRNGSLDGKGQMAPARS